MKTARGARFSSALRNAFGVIAFAAFCAWPASAKSPIQQLSQMGHSSWHVQDGFFSSPNRITQTKDGYIWLGTDSGLVRFDGVRFVPRNTFPDASTATWPITAILAAKDGTLWIGTIGVIAHLIDGKLIRTTFRGVATQLLEDEKGTIWFTRDKVDDGTGPICSIASGRLECYGGPELTLKFADSLSRSKDGGFWIGGSGGLCRWWPGQAADCHSSGALESLAGLVGVNATLTSGGDGSLWVGAARAGTGLGLMKLVHGQLESFAAEGLEGSSLPVSSLLEHDNGSIWVGTLDKGLYRIRDGRAEHFGFADGLSSDTVTAIYQDREGTIWVCTSAGLDAFHPLPVSVFSARQGLPADDVQAVLPARDGTVWIGNLELSGIVGDRVAPPPSPALFRAKAVTSLLEDHAGRLWIGLNRTLNLFENGALKPITTSDGSDIGPIEFIAEDSSNDVWAIRAAAMSQIFRIRDGVVKEQPDRTRFGVPTALAADPVTGMWFGYRDGAIGYYNGNELKMFAADGVSKALVRGLLPESNGTLLAATSRGLLVQRASSRRLLDVEHGLPCPVMRTVLRDAHGAVWLSASCGLVEIGAAELERWWADSDSKVESRLFGATDGWRLGVPDFTPRASVGSDGRLWFATGKVAQVIDPGALGVRNPAPPVVIEAITADRVAFRLGHSLQLPPRTRDIELQYTALSFIVPQRIRFQVQLEGRDLAWRDVGTLRTALYSDLPPGRYRFRVKARNSDGVWNEAGASLDFEIPPLFYQTLWFIALCVFSGVLALYGFYLVRLRQVAASIRDRAAAKNAERERIARDLHDTLLQSTQALILRFQSAASRIPEGDPTRDVLEKALHNADEVVAEGRDRVQDLRTSENAFLDLPQSLAAVGEELARDSPTRFRTLVEGQARALKPSVKEVAYRTGREALVNAFRHAQAGAIELHVIYGEADYRIRIRDDGKGIDVSAPGAGSRPGHWGLPGMRERAQAVGAKFEIWSRPGAGTEIELILPAIVAYEQRVRRFRWMGSRFLARE